MYNANSTGKLVLLGKINVKLEGKSRNYPYPLTSTFQNTNCFLNDSIQQILFL